MSKICSVCTMYLAIGHVECTRFENYSRIEWNTQTRHVGLWARWTGSFYFFSFCLLQSRSSSGTSNTKNKSCSELHFDIICFVRIFTLEVSFWSSKKGYLFLEDILQHKQFKETLGVKLDDLKRFGTFRKGRKLYLNVQNL